MPQSIEEGFKIDNAISLYDLYDHDLAENPCPRGHEIYNFGKPFLGHLHYTLSLYGPCPEERKNVMIEIH